VNNKAHAVFCAHIQHFTIHRASSKSGTQSRDPGINIFQSRNPGIGKAVQDCNL